jgi:hypothetical protein
LCVCACVRVCERERAREREKTGGLVRPEGRRAADAAEAPNMRRVSVALHHVCLPAHAAEGRRTRAGRMCQRIA